jgi:2-polyprenyl-6-hydroxyphenyl methylase/3-demethylubiquinone-9 3-methyltransferase
MSSTRDRLVSPAPFLEAIAYHDNLAAGWDQRYRRGGFKRRADFFENKVLSMVRASGDWLDVGCGSGFFSRLLAERGAAVTAIDGSAEMIAAARSFAGRTPTPRYILPRFEVQNIEDLADRLERFDGVICLNVIEYLSSPEARFADLAAALRPGGTLVVSAPNRRSLVRGLQISVRAAMKPLGRGAFAYLDSSSNSWTRDDLAAMAARNGLEPVAILGFDPIVPSLAHAIAQPSLLYLVCRKPVVGGTS